VTSTEIAAIVIAVLVAATVQNAAGFGFALMCVPLMAVFVDTHVAVVISTILGMGSSTTQAWLGRRDTDRVVARRMTLAALLGMPLGLLVFVLVDENVLKLIVGACVLVIVVLLARRIDLRHVGPHFDLAAGAVSGVLATSVSTNGPPLVFALQARHVSPAVFRPTINTVFAVSAGVSLVLYLVAGKVTGDVLLGVLVALPALVLGIWAGLVLRPRLDGERFRIAVLVLLAAAGASAVVAAVSG
jgi:uncharacterized membrane protein YfcA